MRRPKWLWFEWHKPCYCCFVILVKFSLIILPCAFFNAFLGLHHVCHNFFFFSSQKRLWFSQVKKMTQVWNAFWWDFPDSLQLSFSSFCQWCLYSLILVGNSLVYFVVQIDSHLYSPMYFFLSQLSLDVCKLYTPDELLEIFSNCIL